MARATAKTSSTFMQRLGFYGLGIGIGFVMLGFFSRQRATTMKARQAQQQQQALPQPGQLPLDEQQQGGKVKDETNLTEKPELPAETP